MGFKDSEHWCRVMREFGGEQWNAVFGGGWAVIH